MTKKRISLLTAVLPAFLLPLGTLLNSDTAYAESPVEQSAVAEDSPSQFMKDLTIACERAVGTFNEGLVVQSSENLKTYARVEVRNLIYFLNRYPDKERAQGWMKYLLLEDVKNTLAEKESDLAVIRKSLDRFEQDENGLELDCFTRVRNSLRKYAQALEREDTEILKGDFSAMGSAIPQLVQNYFDTPADPIIPETIAAYLESISDSQPDSQSVRDITNLFQKEFTVPNVVFTTNSKLILPEEPITVEEPTTIQEYIRGTPVYGKGQMKGTVETKFVPNQSLAEIMLTFKANVKTNTQAVSSGVTVLTAGNANVLVQKPLYFDGNITFGSSAVSSNMDASISGINTGRGPLGSQVVYNRVQQEFPYSKAESQRLMQTRVVNEFESRLNGFKLGDDRLSKALSLFKKFDYTPVVKSSTTEDLLECTLLLGNKYQVGPIAPTNIQTGEHDVIVKVHQSALNNPAHFIFANTHLAEKDLNLWMKENLPFIDLEELNAKIDEKAKELSSNSESSETAEDAEDENAPQIDGDDFFVNFDSILPVSVEFNNNILHFHAQIVSFEQKGRTFPGLNIDVVYALEKRETGYFLVLQESEAWPADLERGAMVPARYQVIRRQVKNRMEAIPAEIEIKPVELKEFDYTTSIKKAEEGEDEKQEAKVRGHLLFNEIQIADGWLVLGADVQQAETQTPAEGQKVLTTE